MSDWVKVIADSEEWRALVGGFSDASYKQLPQYSLAVANRVRATSENVVITGPEGPLGVCNVRVKKLPLLPFGIAYINGGPLVLNGATEEPAHSLSRCLAALREEYVARRGHVLRVVGTARPDIPLPHADANFEAAGFEPALAKGHYRTLLIDLNQDLAQIRRGFDQKWRNILNKAERQGVLVESGGNTLLFTQFDRMYRKLVERKGFEADLGPGFFSELQGNLAEPDRFVVHLATHEGQPVAGHVGAFHGDTAVYLLGAATEAGLKLNASYLLQWHVIRHAQARGCRWYDLGGIDPESNPDVYRFKSRMGGRDISAPGPYEAGSPLRRMIVRNAEALFRRIKR